MKIGLEWLLTASSRLQDRRQRSSVIHIVTADSTEFSSHSVSTTIDVSIQSSLTLGCTYLSDMTARCDEDTCDLCAQLKQDAL